jgi:hypothetical protein
MNSFDPLQGGANLPLTEILGPLVYEPLYQGVLPMEFGQKNPFLIGPQFLRQRALVPGKK